MASGSSDPSILEQRRCLLLAAIGSTAEKVPTNATLKKLLADGLLVTIKSWLDDILASKIGGMDLLLHLLTNIIPIPVTKEMVTTSKLGKAVSSVEKHGICVGSGNEAAIKSRIQQVKERWSASVKAMKNVSLTWQYYFLFSVVYKMLTRWFAPPLLAIDRRQVVQRQKQSVLSRPLLPLQQQLQRNPSAKQALHWRTC